MTDQKKIPLKLQDVLAAIKLLDFFDWYRILMGGSNDLCRGIGHHKSPHKRWRFGARDCGNVQWDWIAGARHGRKNNTSPGVLKMVAGCNGRGVKDELYWTIP
jgi:hypothetical protein